MSNRISLQKAPEDRIVDAGFVVEELGFRQRDLARVAYASGEALTQALAQILGPAAAS